MMNKRLDFTKKLKSEKKYHKRDWRDIIICALLVTMLLLYLSATASCLSLLC